MIVGKFEKVKRERFILDAMKYGAPYSAEALGEMYERIILPGRATSGSAGHDFFAPYPIDLIPGHTFTIATGIKCKMQDDWVLMCAPRSGLGFKYGLGLSNTVGVIDADYYYADNDGHILARLHVPGDYPLPVHIEDGQGFMQGLFLPYGVAEGCEDVPVERTGGFGSTTKEL